MRMAVMRVHKTANYTIMSNHHFKEKGMSLKAKGLLSLMLSLPDDWDYSINGLATLSKDGRDSVMSALQELEKFGYLTRTRINDEKGRFAGFDYDIYEEPQKDNPCTENPNTDNPCTENPQQLNTKEINSEGINIRNNKDKQDKQDKRLSPPIDDLSTKLSTNENPLTGVSEQGYEYHDNVMSELYFKPSAFTAKLIEAGYIGDNDLYIGEYNRYFREAVSDYGLEVVRACLWYFIKQVTLRGCQDQFGEPIVSKTSYLKTCIDRGAEKLKALDKWDDMVRRLEEEGLLGKEPEETERKPDMLNWLDY